MCCAFQQKYVFYIFSKRSIYSLVCTIYLLCVFNKKLRRVNFPNLAILTIVETFLVTIFKFLCILIQSIVTQAVRPWCMDVKCRCFGLTNGGHLNSKICFGNCSTNNPNTEADYVSALRRPA